MLSLEKEVRQYKISSLRLFTNWSGKPTEVKWFKTNNLELEQGTSDAL